MKMIKVMEISICSDGPSTSGCQCSLLFAEKQIIKLTYDDKVQLTAFWKQISSGAYDPEKYPDVGYFDVIGNDRR